MIRIHALGAVVMAGLLGLTATAAQAEEKAFPIQVRVDGGALAGAVQADVLSFKGVPFAAPPVGDLRWRPPQPAAPWPGVRPAAEYGHDCMQKPFPSDAAPLGTEPAEDCLVLNVWRPARWTAAKLPVMVWIYGGGFVNGGSSPAVYDGSQFARQGLVFVSFNYRLGRFGFFAHPALTAEAGKEPIGNYGYMDQIAALRWVRRNIAAFGGDPDNVTVFGESAGGISVHMLLTSSQAKGLFRRAAIESGAGRDSLLPMRKVHDDAPGGAPTGESVGLAFAKSVGVEGRDAAALAALRQLPADRLVSGLNMATMIQAASTYSGGPMIDGAIQVETPEAAYRAGRHAKVPLLVGANSMDIGFPFAKTVDEALGGFGDKAKARAAYDPDGSGDAGAVGYKVMMDRLMIEPARFTARSLAAGGAPVYEYRFSYVAQSLRKAIPGATHASEIPFVFDTVAVKYGTDLAPRDAATARAANTYWGNFARTGNPNGPGLPAWPAYQAGSDQILDFTAEGPKPGPDPWRARLDLTEAATSH